MIQTILVVGIFSAAISTVTHAFMDIYTRELYNLHNWRDLCSMELIPGQKQKQESEIEGVAVLDQFCSNAFEGWKGLGETQLQERCPQAQDPKCRAWKGSNKCTVQIKASNKSDTMKVVELTYCAQGVDWDSVKTDNRHLRSNGRGSDRKKQKSRL